MTVEYLARVYVYVCVVIPFILDVMLVVDVPAGVTQEEGHRISHPPSFCGACLNFSLARRIQPLLSLVDREVELCVLTN